VWLRAWVDLDGVVVAVTRLASLHRRRAELSRAIAEVDAEIADELAGTVAANDVPRRKVAETDVRRIEKLARSRGMPLPEKKSR
jgi:hypothetical protein